MSQETMPTLSLETHLRVVNSTKTNIISTVVKDIDPFDWENKKGPAGNFQDVQIPAGKSAERREEVNRVASKCHFTMTLLFADGSRDTYRINQKFAINQAAPDFKKLEGKRLITYDQKKPYLIITVYDLPADAPKVNSKL